MTETTTLTLTDFLLARIAEDEDGARIRAEHGDPWPMRVLAECEAKRRIVGEHEHFRTREAWVEELEEGEPDFGCGVCEQDGEWSAPYPRGWCSTVRILALPFADHPDYDESWRP